MISPISVITLILSITLILCVIMCIFQKNPVYSVILLIVSFVNLSLIFALLGAHFISLLLLFIYAGAISILFIFVFMIVDFKNIMVSTKVLNYYTNFLLLLATLFIVLHTFFIKFDLIKYNLITNYNVNYISLIYSNNELYSIGFFMFNYFFFHFVLMMFILLGAMVAAILITINKNIPLSNNTIIGHSIYDIYKSSL